MIYHEDGTEVLGPKPGLNLRPPRANKAMAYLGNPKLKRANIKMKMSQDEMSEYIKCSQDPVYFIRSFVKIINIDGGLIPFDMFDYQEDLIRHIQDNRFSVVLQARQSGKTITTIAYLLWYILFNSYKRIGLLANKKANSTKALGRLRLAYEKLPMWLQQGAVTWNKGDIELENGSVVETYAAASDAARGESFSFLFVDEVAFIPSTVWDEYYKSSYPTISSGKTSKICLISTPNGLNHFYTIYHAAEKGRNTYKPFKVTWEMVPGRDEAWKAETISNTSEEDFLSEHAVEFLGNSQTLIPSAVLRTLVYQDPISYTENFQIIKQPEIGRRYVSTVDVAQGVGLDSSTLSVIDITEYPFQQVAVYKNNRISPLVFPNVIESISNKYNKAHILVETNDVGYQVVHTLNWEFEYENLISFKDMSETGPKLGIRVNRKTKKIGCNRLKDFIESGKLVVNDEDTINELFAFQVSSDSYEAAYGHDDLVMGLVNFAYYASTAAFAHISNLDFKNEFAEENKRAAIEALTPAPMIDNGLSEDESFFEENGYHDGSKEAGFMM